MAAKIARWGTEITVSTGAAANNTPRVAAIGPTGAATGRFVVVWAQGIDVHGLGDTAAIVGQLYAGDGSANGTPFLINSTLTDGQYAPDVVARVDDEGFAVAWTDESRRSLSLGDDVRMRLFDADGVPGSNDFVAHSAIPMFNNENGPSIDRIGTFGTVFVGYDNSGDGNLPDLYNGVQARAFSNNTPLTGDIIVTNADPHGAGENDIQGQVDVCDLPTTGFLTTWVDNPGGGVAFNFGTAIRGRVYSQLGVAIGTEFTIVGAATAILQDPVGVGMPNGMFAVAWTQDDDPAPGAAVEYNIYCRIYTAAGVGGTPFRLSTTTAHAQFHVALEPLGNDRFIAAWTDASVFSTIKACVFNSDGTRYSDEFTVNTNIPAGATELKPSITVLQEATGPRFVITWLSNGGGVVKSQIFDTVVGQTLGADFFGSERGESYAAQYGDHVLLGNGGADTLTGSPQADRLDGGLNNDVLNGGDGNDVLKGGRNNDTLNGGLGTDVIDWSTAVAAIVFALPASGNGAGPNLPGIEQDTFTSMEGVTGGNGDDVVTGNASANILDGGRGRDSLRGGDGDDTVLGGNETGAGDIILAGDGGSDTVNGGGGNDRIDGGADGDLALNGDAGNDTITGGDGDDNANGGTEDDILYGQAGRDTLRGGAGGDTLYGGDEAGAGDVLLAGDAGIDFISGGLGHDRIDGGADNDRYLGGDAGNDVITGGAGNDRLEGGVDADTLYGQADNDYLIGGLSGDSLYGGSGIDYLHGNDGNDFLQSDSNNDNLYGGLGSDSFNFDPGNGSDSIFDFTDDQDTLIIDPGFGFANAAAVVAATIQTGNHARILLPGADTDIYLWDYLAAGSGNTIANLSNDIAIG